MQIYFHAVNTRNLIETNDNVKKEFAILFGDFVSNKTLFSCILYTLLSFRLPSGYSGQ